MLDLNFNHLRYFWMVAREGSVVAAADELLVSQPTISLQIKQLEQALKVRLFDRAGRRLVLTEAGKLVYSYANEIFQKGQELVNALHDRPQGRAIRLSVGILDVIPKTVVYKLLEPALNLPGGVSIVCREDKSDRLVTDLAARRYDVVLSDSPIGTALQVRGFNHMLGECGVSLFSEAKSAKRLRAGFPKSLNGSPVLLPTQNTAMRRSLAAWFEHNHLHPVVAGEFDDTATMASFGRAGLGIFPAPSVVEKEVQREHGVRLIGRAKNVQERYYAITLEPKVQHPAVVAICESARKELFSR